MTKYERASQLWSILAFAATNRQVLTYDLVSKLTGIPRPGIGKQLEPIQSYCLAENIPPLTAIVVSEITGIPGSGFFAAQDLPMAHIKVFQFDWLNYGCPKVDTFEQY